MPVSVLHFGRKHNNNYICTNMKKTITLILAAMMTVSLSSASATVSDSISSEVAFQKKQKKQVEVKEVTYKVHLHCENCVKKVKENISFEKGVKDLHVCLEDQVVSIKYDASKTSEEKLKASLEKLGFEVSGKAEHGHHH